MAPPENNGLSGLLLSWVYPTPKPANLSHEHHHHPHHGAALGPEHLEVADLIHDVPAGSDNSIVALAESWVAPADPVNTHHKGGMHHSMHLDPLEAGNADPTPENSVLGLLSTWVGSPSSVSQPANISHEHHHHSHHCEALGPDHLELDDLVHSLRVSTENSFVALAESWVSPADPANTSHKGGLHKPTHENPLEIGADITSANSVLALVSSWGLGPAMKDQEEPANVSHEHHHHPHHGEALGPATMTTMDLKRAYSVKA